jgi:hypothetical protein
MVTTLRKLLENVRPLIPVTSSADESDGKKTEEGMMGEPPETNAVTVADPPETRILTSATTRKAADIHTK